MTNKIKPLLQDLNIGNALFLYAAAFGFAEENGYEVVLPGYFKCFSPLFSPKKKFVYDDSEYENIYFDPKFSHTPIVDPDVDFAIKYDVGYFQSYKYFHKYKKELLEQLNPSELLLDKTLDFFSFWCYYSNVAVHVRRGDYTELQNYHPTQPVSYYEEAFSHFPDTDYFLVFSNDPEWCKTNLMPLDKRVFIIDENKTHRGGFNPNISWEQGIDMFLMSLFQGNIIANSSYSWWAAYLNKDLGSCTHKVVYPKNWFGPGYAYHSTKDLVMDGWIGI